MVFEPMGSSQLLEPTLTWPFQTSHVERESQEHELENGRLRERLGAAQTKIASQQQLLQKEKREIQRSLGFVGCAAV